MYREFRPFCSKHGFSYHEGLSCIECKMDRARDAERRRQDEEEERRRRINGGFFGGFR